jgi:uncharacterized membrane protein
MFIVPRELVRPLNIPPAEAMKFIVSGGVAGTETEVIPDSEVSGKMNKKEKGKKKAKD